MDSPALSVGSDFSDFTDEELDQYFANYVPLSNLPTPPPAKENLNLEGKVELNLDPAERGSRCDQFDGGLRGATPELEVYSCHLSNLVPANVCTHRPSIPTIESILARADLPVEILAFASCILDALSQRFAGSLRSSCVSQCPNFRIKPTLNNSFRQQQAVEPEIVVVAALALSLDFLDDKPRSNSHWAKIEAAGAFTARQIEATKRCILQDLEYDLFGIKEGRVMRMMRDMQHAITSPSAKLQNPASKRVESDEERDGKRPKLSLDLGANLQADVGLLSEYLQRAMDHGGGQKLVTVAQLARYTNRHLLKSDVHARRHFLGGIGRTRRCPDVAGVPESYVGIMIPTTKDQDLDLIIWRWNFSHGAFLDSSGSLGTDYELRDTGIAPCEYGLSGFAKGWVA